MILQKIIKSYEMWNNIYRISMFLSLMLSFLILLFNLIFLITDIKISEELIRVKNIFSMITNLLFSIFSILLSVNHVKNKNIKEEEYFIFKRRTITERFLFLIIDVFKNYKKSELKNKSLEIITKCNKINLPEKFSTDQEVYNKILKFKQLMRKNLLMRLRANNYMNFIGFIFFYFGIIIFIVPLVNKNEISDDSSKIVDFFTNFLNQLFSLIFSYLAVIVNNVNLLHNICDSAFILINSSETTKDDILFFFDNFYDIIENPFKSIFKLKTDLEKEKDSVIEVKSLCSKFFGE